MTTKKYISLIKFPWNFVMLSAITILFLFSSCVTQREIEYLQDNNDSLKVFTEAEFPDYRLKPNDELYIQINSLDEGAANVFSNAGNQSSRNSGTISPYGASLMSYSVDKDGYLLLPVIGIVSVKNKTLTQVSEMLIDSLNHILNQPLVTVKLVNRYVSVLGEVRTPGHYTFSQEKLSVYDAIGLAGDITDYGDRKNVILIRNENKENIRINIDLTKSEMLNSDYFNLRPNDIIYVRPMPKKFWGMRQFPWSVFFSAITTGLLIYEIVSGN
jgi:polysaccharide biosynthesis/export protein